MALYMVLCVLFGLLGAYLLVTSAPDASQPVRAHIGALMALFSLLGIVAAQITSVL